MNYNFLLYQRFKDVIFYDKDHSYYYKDKKLTSSTQKKKEVVPEFHTEYWLVYCTLRDMGYNPIPLAKVELIKVDGEAKHYTEYKVDVSKLRKQWDNDREVGLREGSNIHTYLENAWKRKYLKGRIGWLDKYIKDHSHLIPIELELIVSDLKEYAGQIDALLYNTRTKCIEIHDYKSDVEIKFENKYDKLYKPFSHLDSCNWNEYVIQVNIYRELLREVLSINYMYIIHFDKKEKEYTKYEVPYLDVKTLLYDVK